MGSYVEENLLQSETVIYEASLSRWAYFWHIFFGIVLIAVPLAALAKLSQTTPITHIIVGAALIPVVLGLIILFTLWIKFRSTELAVTNRRVIAKFGFIRRETFELNIDRVEGIQVSQGLIGRIFNFGTLRIGGTGNSDPIPNISHPMAFKKAEMETQDVARSSLGR